MNYWPKDVEHRAPLYDFPPAWACAWGDDWYGLWADLVVNGTTQRLRWIERSMPGGFLMGSTQKERDAIEHKDVREWANQHETEPQRVVIPSGFWLADTPCTQAFWLAVLGGENPSHFKTAADAPRRPVERVPIDDDQDGPGVTSFLQALNQRLPEPRAALPSEEQWEYACRADTATAYWWGDGFDPARANADHTGKKDWDAKQSTNPVVCYPPNPWGLFDMHGNVWEWTASPWRERRDAAPGQDAPLARVVRGGSWLYPPRLRPLGLPHLGARRPPQPLPGFPVFPEVFQPRPGGPSLSARRARCQGFAARRAARRAARAPREKAQYP